MLENEFGTAREEDVVQQILDKGEIQEATVCFLVFFFHVLQKQDSNYDAEFRTVRQT